MINQNAQQNNTITENRYRCEHGFTIPGYRSYIATTPEHYEKAYRLRHEVYCTELGWVPENPEGLEIDEFDKDAKLICVETDAGELIGTIRLLDECFDWMVEKFFSETISASAASIKAMSCVEASRNAVLPRFRHKYLCKSRITVLDMMLCTAMNYIWYGLGRTHVLITAEPLMGVILRRRGGAIEQIGPIITMPDQCKITSFLLDLEICKESYEIYHSCLRLHQEYKSV
jgi:N-acyl-L-homoserine lactone synthetase